MKYPRIYKVTIEPFLVQSTSKERLEQEIKDYLNEELMVEKPPDTPTEIKIEEI